MSTDVFDQNSQSSDDNFSLHSGEGDLSFQRDFSLQYRRAGNDNLEMQIACISHFPASSPSTGINLTPLKEVQRQQSSRPGHSSLSKLSLPSSSSPELMPTHEQLCFQEQKVQSFWKMISHPQGLDYQVFLNYLYPLGRSFLFSSMLWIPLFGYLMIRLICLFTYETPLARNDLPPAVTSWYSVLILIVGLFLFIHLLITGYYLYSHIAQHEIQTRNLREFLI